MAVVDEDAMKRMHMRTGHRFKERWHDIHGPSDSPARLLAIFDDERCFGGEMGPDTSKALESGVTMGALIALSMAALFAQREGHRLAALVFVCEGYTRRARPDDPDGLAAMQQLSRGDMSEDFKTNPDTKVGEAQCTYWCTMTPEGMVLWLAIDPFHYEDGGLLVWEEEEPYISSSNQGGTAGDLAEHLQRIFEMFGAKP